MLDFVVFFWIFAIVFWAIIFGTLCSVWAGKKGLDKMNWAIIGAVLGIIGVILLWGTKSKTTSQSPR